MPCLPGLTPVLIEVQDVGVSAGMVELRFPQAPFFIKRAKFGTFPALIMGSKISNVAPSHPTMTIFSVFAMGIHLSAVKGSGPFEITCHLVIKQTLKQN